MFDNDAKKIYFDYENDIIDPCWDSVFKAVFFRYAVDKGKRELINEIIKTEEGIAMASEGLIAFIKDEIERARLLSKYKFAVDYQSDMVESRRTGFAEGKEETLAAVVQSMERHGMSAGDIAEVPGLSADEAARYCRHD